MHNLLAQFLEASCANGSCWWRNCTIGLHSKLWGGWLGTVHWRWQGRASTWGYLWRGSTLLWGMRLGRCLLNWSRSWSPSLWVYLTASVVTGAWRLLLTSTHAHIDSPRSSVKICCLEVKMSRLLRRCTTVIILFIPWADSVPSLRLLLHEVSRMNLCKATP